MSQTFDIVVVGAGPAGAAVARWLALDGCRVMLVERSHFDEPRVGESLAPAVQPLLKELGVWDRFVALGPLPSYGTRSVWGSEAPQEHSYLIAPFQQGWHVDRTAFDRMLADAASRAGARLSFGARVLGCEPVGSRFILNLQQGDRPHQLEADFVVDATGRAASLARRLGAHPVMFDRLVAVAGMFDDPRAGEHCYTLVETTADGWWYSAPVGFDRSVAMLMTDGDLPRTPHAADAGRWHHTLRLAPVTGARVGAATLRWGPRTYSAVSQRLVRTDGARQRWIAVGDAALSVDPISGSGVIRALRTARAAADTVMAALAGDAGAMARYEANRDEECTSYLTTRAGYYRMERRWTGAPFWERRRLDRTSGAD